MQINSLRDLKSFERIISADLRYGIEHKFLHIGGCASGVVIWKVWKGDRNLVRVRYNNDDGGRLEGVTMEEGLSYLWELVDDVFNFLWCYVFSLGKLEYVLDPVYDLDRAIWTQNPYVT